MQNKILLFGILLLFVLHIAVPCIVYAVKAGERAEAFTMLDPDMKMPKPVAAFVADAGCLLGASKEFIPFSGGGWTGNNEFDNVSFSSRGKYAYYLEKCLQDEHYITYNGTVGWMKAVLHGTDGIMKEEELKKLTMPLLVFRVEGDRRVHPGAINHLVNTLENSRLIVAENVRHELLTADSDSLIPYLNAILDFYAA